MFIGICSLLLGTLFLLAGLGIAFLTDFPTSLLPVASFLFMGVFFLKVGMKKCQGENLPPVEQLKGFTPGTYENIGGPSRADLDFGRETYPKTVPKPDDK